VQVEQKKGQYQKILLPFFCSDIFQEQQDPVVLQLEHAEPPASPDEILNPNAVKSTFIGLTFSIKSLLTIYLKLSTVYLLSVSLGSSRAIDKEGPPQPPSFKKIRIGATSLPLK
jgi:hypothetical protein